MGFIASSSTVTVQAKLTAAGRKKLFDSLETVNEPFITKFALGDSDANYTAIDAGFGSLATGAVPQPGEFLSRPRSFVLQSGQFKPSVSHILIDGRQGGTEGHYMTVPIGANVPVNQTVKIETEWPRGTKYDETYHATFITNATAEFTNDTWSYYASNFQFKLIQHEGSWKLQILFNGGLDQSVLDNIIGPDDETGNGWSITVTIHGLESQNQTVVTVDFVK